MPQNPWCSASSSSFHLVLEPSLVKATNAPCWPHKYEYTLYTRMRFFWFFLRACVCKCRAGGRFCRFLEICKLYACKCIEYTHFRQQKTARSSLWPYTSTNTQFTQGRTSIRPEVTWSCARRCVACPWLRILTTHSHSVRTHCTLWFK